MKSYQRNLKNNGFHLDSIERQTFLIESNQLISYFMQENDMMIFRDSKYWLTKKYSTSWDALMPVIAKIKSIVYSKTTFTMFSNEWIQYSRVGKACWDADIESAFYEVCSYILRHNHYEKVQEILKIKEAAIIRKKKIDNL